MTATRHVYVVYHADGSGIETVYTNGTLARAHANAVAWLSMRVYNIQYSLPEGMEQMGMFDRDKEFGANLTATFAKREEFVVWGANVDAEKVQTNIGPARKTRLTVSRIGADREQFEVTTLASAIADKAEEASPEDFPAVVMWMEVPSNYGGDATVLQFVRDYHATRA